MTLLDQTDNHNELVAERVAADAERGAAATAGQRVFHRKPAHRGGIVVREAGPAAARPAAQNRGDAQVFAAKRRLRFAGQGYPFVLLAYQGGRNGRIEALQTYQRQLRVFEPDRDGIFLSNTWGDRSRNARINEAFIRKEIEAGAAAGRRRRADRRRLAEGPHGELRPGQGRLERLLGRRCEFLAARPATFPPRPGAAGQGGPRPGMKFGLWFGPDSSNDAGNWSRDAGRDPRAAPHRRDRLFQDRFGQGHHHGGGANLHRFFDRVLEESAGRVVFDLDVTAEIRPGYFGAPRVGPIFVENRYTDFHRYWPHQTLRNLWMLAQYVDPLRLRIELLNNTRNARLYADDPLAPARYRPDCLFAVAMFANPLGWFEMSNLPDDYVASVSKLVQAWKAERGRCLPGTSCRSATSPTA